MGSSLDLELRPVTAMIVTRPILRRRLLLATASASVCVLAVAGCGSSRHKPTASSHWLAFSQCMRSHGVSNFPDPGAHGGINLNGTNINPFSPAFKTAQSSCSNLLPGLGPGSRRATARQTQQLVSISECMRSHGVTGFPDPTTTPPTSPAGYSIIEGVASNLFLLVPSTINPGSPAFVQAAKACKFH